MDPLIKSQQQDRTGKTAAALILAGAQLRVLIVEDDSSVAPGRNAFVIV